MKKTLLVILALVMALTLVIGPVSMVSATTLPKPVVSGGGSFISGSGWDDGPWAQMWGHSCTFGCNAQITGSSTDPDALLPAKGNFQFQESYQQYNNSWILFIWILAIGQRILKFLWTLSDKWGFIR